MLWHLRCVYQSGISTCWHWILRQELSTFSAAKKHLTTVVCIMVWCWLISWSQAILSVSDDLVLWHVYTIYIMHFLSVLFNEMVQVVEILPEGRQRSISPVWSVIWLLMPWLLVSACHHNPRPEYWHYRINWSFMKKYIYTSVWFGRHFSYVFWFVSSNL